VVIFSLGALCGDFKKIVEKIQFSITADENNDHFNEDNCALTITSLRTVLIMRNVSAKLV
jgi:hypothetical protein